MYRVRFILMGLAIILIHQFGMSQQLKLGNSPSTVTKSALLDMDSNDQGLLLVRISDTSLINALTPPDGMIIFFTPTKQLMVRTNNSWQAITSGPIDTTNIANFNQKVRKLLSAGTGISYDNVTGIITNSGVTSLNGNTGALTMDTGYIANFSYKARTRLSAGTGISYDNTTGIITNTSPSSGGTVTSVGSGYGLTGGPITTTGTLVVDSATLSNYYVRRKDSSTAGGYYPFSTNPKNYLTSVSTTTNTGPLTWSGNGTAGSPLSLTLPVASGSQSGFLSSTDWTTFNNKQAALSGTGFVKINGTTISYDNSTYLTSIDTTNIANFSNKVRTRLSAGTGISYDNTTGIITNASPSSGGTVTNVGSGYGLTGGTITTTGTLVVDSATLSNYYVRRKDSSTAGGYYPFSTNPKNYLTSVSTATNTGPLTWSGNGTAGSPLSLTLPVASGSTNGYLSSTDWNTFNSKAASFTQGNLTEATSSVLTITGGSNAVIGSGTTIQVKQASGSQNGFLSSTDWSTFNNKQAALSGTGFVKINGTTISYDNSTYLTSIDTTNIANFSNKVRTRLSAGTGISYDNTTGIITNTSPSSGGTVTSVGSGYGLTGGPITTTGTLVVDSATLSNYYVRRKDSSTAGGYYPFSTNPKGYLTSNQSVTWTGTGDVSGTASGTTSISPTLTLATVNSNVGSFGTASSVPTITVNGKGLVTAAANTSIQIAESQVTNLTTDLAAKQAQLNGTGFVKASGTTISYDNSTYLTGNQSITLTGDVTGSGATSIATTLAASGVTAGTYGRVTVNSKGIVTAGKRVETYSGTTDVNGNYTVTFTTAYSVAPNIQVTLTGASDVQSYRVTSITTTGFTVLTRSQALGLIFSNAAGVNVDVLITEK